MLDQSNAAPQSWLAFELNVLTRLDFKSVLLPFCGEPRLGAQLKRRGTRILTNDLSQSAWTKAVSEIQNNSERLTETEVETILGDVYVPGFQMKNPALRDWFGETDAWWFENLRANVEKLETPVKRAIALSIGMCVGDYVLSFTPQTRELRQPLSRVFKRLLSVAPAPFDNGHNNLCANKPDRDFIAENHADLMFLRLARAQNLCYKESMGFAAWREEWLRGSCDVWQKLDDGRAGQLGAPVQTKTQYLQLVEDTLKTASHIPVWSIAHIENGFLAASELAEIINGVRRVETIFTKDFSEIAGSKAVIITA